MNLFKSIAIVSLVLGLTVNAAMAKINLMPEEPPACGVVADPNAGANTLSISSPSKDLEKASDHVTYWTKGLCTKKEGKSFYKNLADDCQKAAQHGADRRTQDKGNKIQKCVKGFNAWVALNTKAASDKADADADKAKADEAAALQAKVDACDKMAAGSGSDCACRNEFKTKVSDATSTQDFVNGTTQPLVAGLKTWIPNTGVPAVGQCPAGNAPCQQRQDLIDARTCCALVNGSDCGV